MGWNTIYGGSLKNRINFAKEIVIATKEKVGKKFPIIFRLSGDDFIVDGLKIDESVEIARELEKAGVDAFNVSPGWHESRTPIMLMAIPRMSYIFLSEKIKDNVNVPVIGSVRINDLALAEEILDNGQSDIISIGRPLIADPELPKKYKKRQFDDIRRCIACNQGCFDSLLNFKSISCLYNVRAGKEREYKIKKAKKKKKVMVIGGGPAGLEAGPGGIRDEHVPEHRAESASSKVHTLDGLSAADGTRRHRQRPHADPKEALPEGFLKWPWARPPRFDSARSRPIECPNS